jgi:pimeloyl-ACP methyl ester carboxylesterase
LTRDFLFVSPDAAEKVFRGMAAALGSEVRHHFHTLLLLRPDPPRWTWSVAHEVDAMAEATDPSLRYDIVGYSGGAAIAEAFSVAHPSRVRSLCLIEPPWIGNDDWSDAEREFTRRFDALMDLDDLSVNNGFRELFAPGIAISETPDLVEVERWGKALRKVWRGFRSAPLDRSKLAALDVPVLLPVGEKSAVKLHEQARFLAANVFAKARILTIDDVDHFNIFKLGATEIAGALAEM